MSFRGMLNRTLRVERPVDSPDGLGGVHQDWAVVCHGVRCSINPVESMEGMVYQRLGVDVTHVVWLEPLGYEGFDEQHRIVLDDGATYNFIGMVDVGGRRRIWELRVKRVK